MATTTKKPKKPKLMPRQYAAKIQLVCPFCESHDLVWSPVEVETSHHLHAEVKCNKCGASWDDEYTLTGYLLHEDES